MAGARLRPDPSVTVAELETVLAGWLEGQCTRDVWVLTQDLHKQTFNSAPRCELLAKYSGLASGFLRLAPNSVLQHLKLAAALVIMHESRPCLFYSGGAVVAAGLLSGHLRVALSKHRAMKDDPVKHRPTLSKARHMHLLPQMHPDCFSMHLYASNMFGCIACIQIVASDASDASGPPLPTPHTLLTSHPAASHPLFPLICSPSSSLSASLLHPLLSSPSPSSPFSPSSCSSLHLHPKYVGVGDGSDHLQDLELYPMFVRDASEVCECVCVDASSA